MKPLSAQSQPRGEGFLAMRDFCTAPCAGAKFQCNVIFLCKSMLLILINGFLSFRVVIDANQRFTGAISLPQHKSMQRVRFTTLADKNGNCLFFWESQWSWIWWLFFFKFLSKFAVKWQFESCTLISFTNCTYTHILNPKSLGFL